jgi:16S rRNA (adenine1518-N6/adenine1519-N6)-dimethyltransferase
MAAPEAELSECFDTFDEAGRSIGRVPRKEVHERGLWHRSAHVYLFDQRGALIIQQRATGKDLFPGRWDFSVGEHLKPGEGYLEGALRGLKEELGVTGVNLVPMSGVRRWCWEMPESGIFDRELQQAFRGRYGGGLWPDPLEVADVQRVPLATLAQWLQRAPDEFTPWFVEELSHLGLLAAL